jgi:hypothetical protein
MKIYWRRQKNASGRIWITHLCGNTLQQAYETFSFEPQAVLYLSAGNPFFIKSEGSLTCAQELTSFHYPEQNEYRLHPPILFLSDPFYNYLPIYACVFQVVFAFIFPHQNPVCTSPNIHTTYPAYLILFALIIQIISDEEYKS